MSEEIDEIRNWVTRLREISLEGTLLFFVGLLFMALGMINPQGDYSSSWTMGGGFLFLGGVIFIASSKLNR